jgi:pyrroloquinoline quinone biosynthesis protein B
MKKWILLVSALIFTCTPSEKSTKQPVSDTFITVLGIAQDAGYPQADCDKFNCQQYWVGAAEARYATSLGLIDKASGQSWMFEATPDFKHQLHALKSEDRKSKLSGIFLTHAHIGHYTGLMHLGHEAMGATALPVYAMPTMRTFLRENGPWSQLVDFENISLLPLTHDSTIQLTDQLSVTPFLVPHRDEFSETVGYTITSDSTSVLFIPDINKWHVWDRDIVEEIRKVDFAFLDATFFDSNELPGRDMSSIPHPFVEESLELFKELTPEERQKVIFIHFNHTNPLILNSMERQQVENLGYQVAFEGMRISM